MASIFTYESIKYQAETYLLNLVIDIAEASSKRKALAKIKLAAKIRYFLRALTVCEDDYLTAQQTYVIYSALQELCEITAFPTAPSISPVVSQPILAGEQGPIGPTGATGATGPIGPTGATGATGEVPAARTISTGTGLTGGGDLYTDRAISIAAGGVSATELATNAVTTTKIADSNVTTAKIADLNVTAAKIANSTITATQLASNAVTTAKITDLNVTSGKIANSAVTATQLASNAVTTAKINAAAVTNAKMATNSVDSAQIVSGAVDLAHMSSNSVDSPQIVSGAVDLSHMSANSIDSAQYVDGSIDDEHLAEARIKSVGVQLLTKVVDIGEWDMDTDSSVNVLHGVSLDKIRDVSVIIRNDTNSTYRPISQIHGLGLAIPGSFSITASNIVLLREIGGSFDGTGYDADSASPESLGVGGNRGWVTITYEA